MRTRDWLPQTFLFLAIAFFFYTHLKYTDFLSELSISLTALIYFMLAQAFYPPGRDELKVYIFLIFGSVMWRSVVFSVAVYLNARGVTFIPEYTIRLVTTTPMWIAGILLYFYIKQKQ